MRIAIFGGTFDPIHGGHLRAARAAARKLKLDRILFVPSGNPPHKVEDGLTPFAHRYAMVALATGGDERFVPSLLEAPAPGGGPNYSIDTVLAAKRTLKKIDRIFFLLGADAFLDLPHWKDFRRLLNSTDFVVVSRPGFSIAQIAESFPSDLRVKPGSKARPDSLSLRRTKIHLLTGLDVAIASSEIRTAIRGGRSVAGLVPPLVEQYIMKEGLYRPGRVGRTKR